MMKNIMYLADALNDVGGYDQTGGFLSHPYYIVAGGIPIVVYIGFGIKVAKDYFFGKKGSVTIKSITQEALIATGIIVGFEIIPVLYKIIMYFIHLFTGY